MCMHVLNIMCKILYIIFYTAMYIDLYYGDVHMFRKDLDRVRGICKDAKVCWTYIECAENWQRCKKP